jgi:hypothetical protein
MLKVLWPTMRPIVWGVGIWSAMLLLFPVGIIYDDVGGLNPSAMSMRQIEQFASAFGAMTATWAVFTGLITALGVWSPDEQGRHIYALSLPVSRGHYVMLRLALGAMVLSALSLVQGIIAVGLAAWIAPPPPLQAYPVAVSVRAWLTTLTTFALVSAFAVNNPFERVQRFLSRRFPTPVVVLVWVAVVPSVLWLWLLSDSAVGVALRDATVHPWSPVRLVLANWSLFDG